MKHGLLMVLALLLALPAGATGKDALARADTSWNELRLRADVAGLDRLLAEDWQLTHSDGRVQTKADYLRELATSQRSNQAIGNEGVQMRRYGDTAVVTGTSVQSGTSKGVPWNGRFRFTRVWILRDGGWRMIASHSSRIAEPARP